MAARKKAAKKPAKKSRKKSPKKRAKKAARAAGKQGKTTTKTKSPDDLKGCDDHMIPDANCEPCLEKFGMTLETPNRQSMMSIGMLRGRFQPGVSGNPAGRVPGRRSMTEVMRMLLDEGIVVDPALGPIEKREAIGRILLSLVMRPSPRRWAMELLMNREWPEESNQNHKFSGVVQVVMDEDDLEA